MRVSATKSAQRVERNQYISYKKIKGYGLGNSYPQKILEIVGSSGTGKVCVDLSIKFIEGAGFTDVTLSETILNAKGERANSILRKFAKDLKYFNGFACLVKYDYKGVPVEYYNVPFEHCRLEINNSLKYTGRIAVYNDWTGIMGIPYDQDHVVFIPRYNPELVPLQIAEAGSPENYKGQIFYFTADGDFEYPVCPFDPIITDMLTEESVSTVKHRNAKYNFLPSGILVRKGIKPRTLENGSIDPADAYNREQAESSAEFKRIQGDENASKIWVVDVDADEEKPEFIDFTAKNYDRQYEVTEKTVQENIGRAFMIPPIIRGVDVGAGFGSELVAQAYDFMNSVTGNERRMLEVAFKDLLTLYRIQFTDFSIAPLEYIYKATNPNGTTNNQI
jgi:hypothetical protein